MKNINIVNKIISKRLDISLKDVASVNDHYWKTSRDKLVKNEATTLFWKHIGGLTISKFKLYKEIRRQIAKIRVVRVSEKYSETGREKTINEAKEKLKRLLYHRNVLAVDEYNKRISSINEEGSDELSIDNEFDLDNNQIEDEPLD